MANARRTTQTGHFFDLPRLMKERGLTSSSLARDANLAYATITVAKSGKRIPIKTAQTIFESLKNASESLDADEIEFSKIFISSDELPETVASRTHEIEGLDATAYLILSLTNAITWESNDNTDGIRLITSKEIYSLAAVFSRFLDKNESEYRNFRENLISSLTKAYVQSFYASSAFNVRSAFEEPGQFLSHIFREFGISTVGTIDEKLQIEVARIERSLRELEEKGLIVDPIVETVGMVTIAVVGLIPTSFTKRTEEGEVVYRKISALLWDYERLDDEKKSEVRFHIRADEIVNGIKYAVAQANKLINDPDQPIR